MILRARPESERSEIPSVEPRISAALQQDTCSPCSIASLDGKTLSSGNSMPSSFFNLPPEIRNSIYEFVLGPPLHPSVCLTGLKGLDLNPSKGFRYDRGVPSTTNPANWEHYYCHVEPGILSILLVSRQIYTEAFHVFYSCHCFSFFDTDQLYRFLRNIGYARRQQLRAVYFMWRGPRSKDAFRLLKTCRGLKSLQFTVPCSHPPGYAALREVRGLGTVQVRALIHFVPYCHSHEHVHPVSFSHSGDYYCHCKCRKDGDPKSSIQELETAMMRPRHLRTRADERQYPKSLRGKQEQFRKSQEQVLLAEGMEYLTGSAAETLIWASAQR